MPTVIASAAVIVALGLAWRFAQRSSEPTGAAGNRRAPTEIADAVPLVRDADGTYRPAADEE
ncbi:hypothetical protein [Pinisolibacter aquiterrae]|uniref:hypothetical protein n=1 Tax=Pinisolibacter aquiterrae TaxID=2815579 RepID=UPI001C3D715A|nr:hypothetical protein [Pinisolibacter aquiterrae]MBV5262613.1 hypothetical protein [Pinisolibacter aquiterrae]MCC8237065.1 hypothetical protein [Pinisolibacter aquiterrae]